MEKGRERISRMKAYREQTETSPMPKISGAVLELRLWAIDNFERRKAKGNLPLSGTHGIKHWDNVYLNGLGLLDDGADDKVVAAFAYTHDAFRNHDGRDESHGPRAAKEIVSIRETYLSFLDDGEFLALQKACRLHTKSDGTDNPTLNACFDADRLDLMRVGITPDYRKMCSPLGREIAKKRFGG